MYNNEIMLFDNEELNAHIRVVDIDGEPWFVAKDVCDILGTNPHDLRKILDHDEISDLPSNCDTIPVAPNGAPDRVSDRSKGGRAPKIISESGLYTCTIKSRKPIAKPFQRWVTREVLPTLRKTGSYGKPNQLPTLREALEGWLEEVKAHEQTKLERDEAIRTKALISDKKTATAMQTAGVISRRFNQLRRQYDELSDAYNELKESDSMHGFRQYKKLAKEHKELTDKYNALKKEQMEFRHVHNVDPSVLSILNGINELVANAEK